MTLRTTLLAALALVASAGAAAAQYYPPPYSPYPPRYGYGYRQVQIGYLCYTSRGTCDLGQGFPLGAPCRCDIPGFGRKRGFVSQ